MAGHAPIRDRSFPVNLWNGTNLCPRQGPGMNNKSKFFKILKWIGLCCWNVLKEFLVLVLLWLSFWLVSSANFIFHDPTGVVTNFYCVVLGLPIGYLVIGFLRKGTRGLPIPLLIIFLLLLIGLFDWIYYPRDAVEPPFVGLPATLFICFFELATLVALGRGIATTLSRKQDL